MAGQAERTLRPEDEISHYRIVGPLGAGGMGEVYLAQDRTLERNVALKILPPELVRSEERVRRFVLEAKSASSLNHPNIVTIYEIGQDAVERAGRRADSEPVHYISMELVERQDAADADPRRQGRPAHAARLPGAGRRRPRQGARARASSTATSSRATSWSRADGFAKVLDFGLAKLTEKRRRDADIASAPRPAPPSATGAAASCSARSATCRPSRWRGKAVDHRSDIFSFGCILYEAATRRAPSRPSPASRRCTRSSTRSRSPIEEINPKVPAELRRLIRRCLAKSPDQRLQSMKDLAIELREIVDDYDALSASASSGQPRGRRSRSKAGRTWRRPALLRGRARAVVVLGLAVAGWWALSARRQAGAGAQAFQNMRMSTADEPRRRPRLRDLRRRPLPRVHGGAARARRACACDQVATGSDVEVAARAATPASRARLLARRELPLLPQPQAATPRATGRSSRSRRSAGPRRSGPSTSTRA